VIVSFIRLSAYIARKMAGPYRASSSPPIACPRCTRPLPPGELAWCFDNCGIWVAASAAPAVFERTELAPSRLTSWRHARAACPHCSVQMALHGHDMALFLGCAEHGFWVEAETIKLTGLGRRAVAARLQQARAVVDAAHAERTRAEREAREREERDRRDRAEEAAARLREHQAREAAREEALRRERAEREAACAPYLELIHAAIATGDALPLAEKLAELERAVAALVTRRSEP
jgi:hypothetical protein